MGQINMCSKEADLDALCRAKFDSFNARHCGALCMMAGRFHAEALFLTSLSKWLSFDIRDSGSFNPKNCANVMQAAGRLGLKPLDHKVVRDMVIRVHHIGAGADPMSASQALLGAANLRIHEVPDLVKYVDGFVGAAARLRMGFDARGAANCLWAAGALRPLRSADTDALVIRASEFCDSEDLLPVHASQALVGAANLRIHEVRDLVKYVDGFVGAAARLCEGFGAQGASNCPSAPGALLLQPGGVLDALVLQDSEDLFAIEASQALVGAANLSLHTVAQQLQPAPLIADIGDSAFEVPGLVVAALVDDDDEPPALDDNGDEPPALDDNGDEPPELE